ncbi:hypothetical protein [Bradyrhizobium sp. CCBAU 11434]|uniref:hypothetical protein n=1 Tax=Bradyrhizobium sp. CCBAU 11434 TaxID=1630885 RepID=UPI0023054388|nr:hypothetical protein [Bradyrhizobium sp. CCBAU 11434]
MDRLYVLATAFILAGFLSGGIYSISSSSGGTYIVNRFTGSAWYCFGRCVRQTYENSN